MKILAIDSSGLVASVAVVEENRILAEFNVNNKKTHSQTLLPMIDTLQKILDLQLSDLDAIAVAKGPGSFTGLRIGSATAKGLALALEKPIVAVSTLEAMAYQCYGTDSLICPMMDARRKQVYTALFSWRDGHFARKLADAPTPVAEILQELNQRGDRVLLLGDGVPVYQDIIGRELAVPYSCAPAFMNRQRAAALGILACAYAKEGAFTDPDMFRPEYLRLSQAERERREREEAGQESKKT